ncbi:S-adenosyl-L-methionine-dependent methyltransferase [Neofusicoccum parvum]|uniref:S-adenosyl-L-methionine-dependent methyltransferase n=2 Tax=Neofusicoccum parvum TaxID=310453 RepID=A0ACB5SCZ2_9PEZI|nr:putative methyltransferase type 12 protein [Neofusicoccum parvum UCRNP2]GME35531.1 S-adenosyl-L-methionine-dependent methyltransferase [Neofusicoccum parvum]GME53115.1 S-adenosyl-L-methionine-dependent methyltransferase [Neofusicoccum parvum]
MSHHDAADRPPNSSSDESLLGRHLEIDDCDSALGDDDRDAESAFTSAASRATDWRFENGRRYHAYDDGAYNLPNDELEQDRLDLQHTMWRMIHSGALHMSPVPDTVGSVLDVGCGTGVWTIQFAEEHPNAHVIGTDLSPVQPHFVPPNCEFLVDNAEREWAFTRRFDFIHARMLCMGMHDWPRFFRQCWDNLNPGGWLELREITFPWGSADGTAVADSPLLDWSEKVRLGAAKAGIDTTACASFEGHLQSIGFVHIRKETPSWPLGPWPRGSREKKMGAYALENLESGLHAVSSAVFSRYLDMSTESIELSLMEARKDLHDPTKHFYAPL